jgi:DNA-binding Xre family transcriptional regulator
MLKKERGGKMIRYKIDVFAELKKKGFNQTRIQRDNLLSKQTMQNIKAGKSITLETLNKICIMCRLQPGDIVEVVPTDEEKIKYY